MTRPEGAVATVAATAARDGHWLLAGALMEPARSSSAGPLELLVRDGVIEVLRPVAKSGEYAADGAKGEGWVLVPLMVNAHDHGRGSGNVLAGIPDAPLERWLGSLRAARGSTSQEELVGDAARDLLASGVGATVICVNPQGPDTAAEVATAATAATRAGIRAAIVYPLTDTMGDVYGRPRNASGWTPAEVEAQLEQVETVARGIEDPGIEVQLGPAGPQWVSEPTLAAVGRHAEQTGRRVHLHLLESRAQRAWADRTYPEGIVELLDRVGLLGPHVCLAHGTHLRSEELAIVAAHGCVLSLNASSNLRLASGIPPVAWALGSALDVGAGLDGLALCDDGDYWTELRLVRGLEQAQSGCATDSRALFERVLRGGRAALGAAAPRQPAVGEAADFALLDLSGYEHLVDRQGWSYADVALAVGRPDRVREVWVAGRRVHARPSGESPPHSDSLGNSGNGSGR